MTLTVRGRGMRPFHQLHSDFGNVMQWDGVELTTRYIFKTQLEADVSPELIAKPGRRTPT